MTLHNLPNFLNRSPPLLLDGRQSPPARRTSFPIFPDTSHQRHRARVGRSIWNMIRPSKNPFRLFQSPRIRPLGTKWEILARSGLTKWVWSAPQSTHFSDNVFQMWIFFGKRGQICLYPCPVHWVGGNSFESRRHQGPHALNPSRIWDAREMNKFRAGGEGQITKSVRCHKSHSLQGGRIRGASGM